MSGALVLAAHGSRRDPAANALVRRLAHAVRERRLFDEVAVAFHQGEPAFSTVLDELGSEAVDGVEWVRLYRRPGHVLGPLRRGVDRAGAVLATGADREEALARARRAADAVRFRVDADAP